MTNDIMINYLMTFIITILKVLINFTNAINVINYFINYLSFN
jgi:hypothetical protein